MLAPNASCDKNAWGATGPAVIEVRTCVSIFVSPVVSLRLVSGRLASLENETPGHCFTRCEPPWKFADYAARGDRGSISQPRWSSSLRQFQSDYSGRLCLSC